MAQQFMYQGVRVSQEFSLKKLQEKNETKAKKELGPVVIDVIDTTEDKKETKQRKSRIKL